MNQIFVKYKRSLCLLICISLLTLNIQAFGQEIMPYDVFVQEASQELEELQSILTKLKNPDWLLKSSQDVINSNLVEFEETYIKTRGKYLAYSEQINAGIDKQGIEAAALRYSAPYEGVPSPIPMEDMIMLDKKLLKPWKSISWNSADPKPEILNQARQYEILDEGYLLSGARYLDDKEMQVFDDFVKYFEYKVKEMSGVIKIDQKIQNYLARDAMTPLDVMRFAFYHKMLPTQQAGVRLVSRAMEKEVPINILAKNIYRYLSDWKPQLKDPKAHNTTHLTNKLKRMSPEDRIQYVEKFTGLEKGQQIFIEDYTKLDPHAKKYIGAKITESFLPLAIFATILTVVNITDVMAENHYNNATVKQRVLEEIGKKIEDGTASDEDLWKFFTNPTSQKFVETDTVYTLSFVKFAAKLYQAEKILNAIQTEEAKQKQDIENKFIYHYQEKSDILNKDSINIF